MSELPLRPLGFGEVLDLSFQLYRRDFAWYTQVALLGLLPAAFLTVVAQNAMAEVMLGFPATSVDAGVLANATVLVVVVVLADTVAKMALAVGMAARTRGAPPPAVAQCYGRGLARLHRIAAAGSVMLLGGSGAFVLAFSVAAAAMAAAIAVGGVFAGLATMLLFSLPGLALLVWMVAGTAVLLPVVVVEDRGGLSSLRRSFRLARGDRWRMAALVGVALVMVLLPTLAVDAFAGTWEYLTGGSASLVSAGGGQQWLWAAVGLLVSAVTMPLWVACHMVLYHDRLVRAEGYDIEAAADALAR